MVKVVGVRFKKACKVYDFECGDLDIRPMDLVIIEVDRGLGMGTVVYSPREVDPSTLARPLKKVVRKADAVDIERNGFNSERETEAFRICREKIEQLRLPMKLIRVEYLFDSSKAIFYFTSETRVDFRDLVKDLAAGFHTRIEMRQIGVRDEAKMVGGLGPCGRELCCSSFLSDFEPVTIKMAKEQNLALNPVKISGVCGRLMCCLSYEHGMYEGEKRERGDRSGKGGRGGQPGKGDNAEKGGHGNRDDKSNRGGKPNRPDRPDRGDRGENADRRGGSSGKADPLARAAKPGCNGCNDHGPAPEGKEGPPQSRPET